MAGDDKFAHIKAVQAEHVDELMTYPNVIGVAIGYRKVDGELTEEPALIVMVDHKLPVAQLAEDAILPRELDGVTVDVQEMGGLFTAR